MSLTTRHLRALPNPDHARQEALGGTVLEKLRDLRTKQRQATERDLLRSIARGFRNGPPVVLPSHLLAQKFDSMADEVGAEG